MKKYLPLPFCILLASCAPPVNTTTTGIPVGGGGPQGSAIPAPGTAPTTGAGAVQTVRGAREAASTFQTFRNLFRGF